MQDEVFRFTYELYSNLVIAKYLKTVYIVRTLLKDQSLSKFQWSWKEP
jgi:hypothetical protein